MKYTKNAWVLFNEMFKNGEDIVVIDEFDILYWGKIQVDKADPDLGFHLKRINGKMKFLYWKEIRFMGQDGFPVRELSGADGSDTIELEKPVEAKIRKAVAPTPQDIHHYHTRTRVRYMAFGDPFLIEDCEVKLFNPGNYGMHHYLRDEEECLALTAKDGAVAQLYNLPEIYYAEFG